MKHSSARFTALAAGLLLGFTGLNAQADTGKLLLTGGVSSIDGAAGGGLTPWAVIGSNAEDGEIGFSANGYPKPRGVVTGTARF
jgi:Protein of unknown function (DUF3034)